MRTLSISQVTLTFTGILTQGPFIPGNLYWKAQVFKSTTVLKYVTNSPILSSLNGILVFLSMILSTAAALPKSERCITNED